MRVAKLAGGLLICAGTMMAQQTVPTPAPGTVVATPAAPKPQLPTLITDTTKPDVTKYLNRPELLTFCTGQLAEFNDKDADMIFIGDSITQGWRSRGEEVWQKYFVPRHALDFGISGDTTQNVLWRLENYPVARLHPKVAVVLIGTNNTHDTAPDVARGTEAVVTKVQTMWPGIKVILVSIMPNARANDLMMAADAILKPFADGKSVYYLDLVPVMTPTDDGNFKGLGKDKLHPDAGGYQLWADAMLPLLNTLLPPPAGETPAQ
jgi:lysophospholipase L1-like esterase